MTKPRTYVPPPGIDAMVFADVAAAWLAGTGRVRLTDEEHGAIRFWLKRHSRTCILAAIEAAPSPLTLEGVHAMLESEPQKESGE